MNSITFVYKGRYQVREANTLEYLSAIANERGIKTHLVYDEDIFGVTDNILNFPFLNKLLTSQERIIDKIVKLNSEYVVFILGFNNFHFYKTISKNIKNKRKAETILINPFFLKKEFIDFDYILSGEPEKVFINFLENIKNNKKEKEIRIQETIDLNIIPMPDKTIFENYINFNDSYLVYTGKGCIYSCSYCEETLYKNNYGNSYYRRRNIDNVIKELLSAKQKYNIKEVIFKDSVFTNDKKWLNDFLLKYKEVINVPYKCFVKAQNFDEEIINLLKNSGCYCVEFGVQTLNEEIKKNILCRFEKNESLIKAFSICDDFKLKYDIDVMFGLPGESITDHLISAITYSKLKYLNRIKCHNLIYYPGSDILSYAMGKKILSEETINKIKNGDAGDFFYKPSEYGSVKKIDKCFKNYFKILPLFSAKVNNFIIKKKIYIFFSIIPKSIIIILQILLAIKNKDKRFWIYFKYYPRKILISVK